ncbi:MAG: hypothetical protein AAF517_12890 [Planctomycetota bacterium]
MCFAFLLVALLSLSVASSAEEPDLKLEVVRLWSSSVTNPHEVAGIHSRGGGRFLSGGSTYSRETGESHWWGEIDAKGKRVRRGENWDRRGYRDSKIVSVLPAGDDTWVVGERTLTRFDKEGKAKFSRSIFKLSPIERYSLGFSSAVTTRDGGLVLVGLSQKSRGSMDGWIVRVDANGQLVWEKDVNLGNEDWFLHVLPMAAKGKERYVTVGVSGKANKFGSGFSRSVVVSFSGDGTKLRERSFSGSLSPNQQSVATLSDGRVLLAYSKSQFPTRDAWLACMDSNLRILWDQQIGKAQVTAYSPCVGTNRHGQAIVTWNAARGNTVWRVDLQQGERLASKTFPDTRAFFVGGIFRVLLFSLFIFTSL